MDETSYAFLQQERKKLEENVRYDALTDVLSHTAIRKEIQSHSSGTIFLANIDRIEWINQTYGHLEGDRSLYTAARLLRYMIGLTGEIGRIGMTEFLIYIPAELSQVQMETFEQRVTARFLSEEQKLGHDIGLHVILTGKVIQQNEEYAAAVACMRRSIAEKIDRISSQTAEAPQPALTGWDKDIAHIRTEMEEEIRKSGAFCPSYETFKGIYRFLQRCMLRNDQHVCTILFSLEDKAQYNDAPEEKERKMQQLGQLLQEDLRLGDVFTRYSSCQYVALVVDVNEELAERIAQRVRDHFIQKTGDRDNIIIHCCYELQSAKLFL